MAFVALLKDKVRIKFMFYVIFLKFQCYRVQSDDRIVSCFSTLAKTIRTSVSLCGTLRATAMLDVNSASPAKKVFSYITQLKKVNPSQT